MTSFSWSREQFAKFKPRVRRPMPTRLLCSTFHTRPRLYSHLSRAFSSEARKLKADADAENRAYSNTLLLPKTPFKLHPDWKEVEKKYRKLTCDELYRWQV